MIFSNGLERSFQFGQPEVSSATDAFNINLPANIESKPQLMDAYARLMHPPYFGSNWDALYDLLCDLTWIEKPVVRVLHQDMPLVMDSEAAKTYIKLLVDALDSWKADNPKRLEVWFPRRTNKSNE